MQVAAPSIPLPRGRVDNRPLVDTRALEGLAVVALGLLAIATRLVLRTLYLFNWDAIQFSLGVQRFDIAAHRPHPPGYLGYVLLGRLATRIAGGDTQTGLVLLSAVAEGAAVLLAYAAARSLWGRFAGWSAAVLLFTSPLFWFYGATALSYALEPVLSLALLWSAHRAGRGSARALVVAALVVGLAGAIRPTDEAFLAIPLAWTGWRTWKSGRRGPLVAASGVLALATCAWLAPLMVMSGGPGRYLLVSRELSAHASDTSAIWKTGLSGLQLNGGAVLAGLALALGLLAPLALTYLLVRRLPGMATQVRGLDRDYATLAWALLAPTLVVYVLVHIGQLGYILLVLPVMLLPAGFVISTLARAVFGVARAGLAGVGLLAVCAVANVATFAMPQDGLRDQLAQRDVYVANLLSTVRGYDPATTVLVTSAEANGSYRLAQYYLPAYTVIAVGTDKHHHAGEMFATDGSAPEYDLARFDRAGALRFPAGTRTVLVLDRDAANLFGDRTRLSPLAYGDDWHVWSASAVAAGPDAAGSSVYVSRADCPCIGAGNTMPVPVPHQPL